MSAKVTVLEALDRILPGLDAEIARQAKPIFEKQGMAFRLGVRVAASLCGQQPVCGGVRRDAPIRCDRVLLAVGRVPCTSDLGLESAGIHCDPRGRIPVNAAWETAVTGIYAVGDCIVGPMLAHKASDEAVACVEWIVTGYGHVKYDAIPAVVYTHPEIAAVGKTEDDLRAAAGSIRKGSSRSAPTAAPGPWVTCRAWSRCWLTPTPDRVLGVHILGPRAGDLIAEAVVSMNFGASSEDIARSSHAHPTLSEALHEAALDVFGRALHAL